MYPGYENIPPPAIVQTWQAIVWVLLTLVMFFAWWAFFARRLSQDFTLSERLLGTFIATITQILATSLILGFVGILFWWPLCIFNVVVTGILIFRASKLKTGWNLSYEIQLLYSSLLKLSSSSVALLILGIAAIFLGVWMIYIGLLLPAWCFDSWNVILPWTAYAHQEGHLGPFLQPNEFINAYPMNTEIMFLWWIIGQGSDRLAHIGQAPFMFAAMLATYIIARNIGARKVDAAIAGLVVISVPMAFQGMWITKNDLAVMGVVLSAMAFLSKRNIVQWSVILAGCATGFSLGSKGPFYLVGLLVFLVFRLVPGKLYGLTELKGSRSEKGTVAVLLFLGLTILLGTYFYLRNWMFLGNPMGIFKVQIGSMVLFDGIDPGHELFRAGAWGGTLHEQMQGKPVTPFIVDGFFDPATYQFALTRIGGWGPLFTSLLLPAIPAAFLWALTRKKWMLPAIIIGLAIPMLFYKPVQLVMIRYHLQMVGCGAVAFAFLLTMLQKTKLRTPFVGLTVVLMALSIFYYGPPSYGVMLDPQIAGEMRSQSYESRDRFAFFRDLWIDDNFLAALDESTQPGTTIAYTTIPGENKLYALWNGNFSNRVVFVPWVDSGENWSRDLTDAGADSVFVGLDSEQLDWAGSHPGMFTLVYQSSLGAIYKINQ